VSDTNTWQFPHPIGALIHISGRKYLGKGIWEEVQFPKSTQAVLSKFRKAKACQEYAVEHNGNSVTHLEDNLGNYCHPWVSIIYSCTTRISQKGVEPDLSPESHDPLPTTNGIEQQLMQVKHGGWMGTETISMTHFGCHVAALLCPQSPTVFSVEGGVSMGRGDLNAGLFVGYTGEIAAEEGLTEIVVDDITWWACLEGVLTAQKNRLWDILRNNCPYLVTSVHQMRHCSPETIAYDLIPKDNAVWQIAKRRRQYTLLEIQWIHTYVGSLLAAKIISPVDTGMVYSDENGQKIPIQQTLHVTLTPKGKENFRPASIMCISTINSTVTFGKFAILKNVYADRLEPPIFRNRRIQWIFRLTNGKQQTSDRFCYCRMGNIRLELPSIWPAGRT